MDVLSNTELTLGFSRESGRVTVRVTGELDAAGSGKVDAALRELTEGQGNLSIDLDLQDAQGVNSAFVMMLGRSHRWMEAHGGVMTVNDLGPEVQPLEYLVGFRSTRTDIHNLFP